MCQRDTLQCPVAVVRVGWGGGALPRDREGRARQFDLFEAFVEQIERYADVFATEIKRAAARARQEEDIRVAVERQLALIGERLDVRLEGQHEYTLLRGHIDSVYGSVFIEYKNPSDPAA